MERDDGYTVEAGEEEEEEEEEEAVTPMNIHCAK